MTVIDLKVIVVASSTLVLFGGLLWSGAVNGIRRKMAVKS